MTIPADGDFAALGFLEISNLPRGIVALDQMVKRAPVQVLIARTIPPSHYLIGIGAGIAEVEEAVEAATATASDALLEAFIIRNPAGDLVHGLQSRLAPAPRASIAIVETDHLPGCLLSLDRVLKETEVRLLELRLGAGLHGRGAFILSGALDMLGEVQDVIAQAIPEHANLKTEVIAQLHEDLPTRLLLPEPLGLYGPPDARNG